MKAFTKITVAGVTALGMAATGSAAFATDQTGNASAQIQQAISITESMRR